MNGRLTLEELAKRRAEILDGIATRGEVWEIEPPGFVLGPRQVLGRILGFYDEEYGWPVTVEADGAIEEFVPRRRHHPFIRRGAEVVAVAVSRGEYDDLLKSGPGPAPTP